jgi:hypothetical protein
MGRFQISTHGRLQDWIAVQNGYFEDEGLDYELDVRAQQNADQDIEPAGHDGVRTGAYELYRAGGGGKKGMSCACHWAVNQAARDEVEQQGARKILDTTFMAGFMFEFETDPVDVEKYFNGLKRAQMELDLQPEPYKEHYLKEIPERCHSMIDVRRFGPGERIVFLPYTADSYERSQNWMRERSLFETGDAPAPFESVVQV